MIKGINKHKKLIPILIVAIVPLIIMIWGASHVSTPPDTEKRPLQKEASKRDVPMSGPVLEEELDDAIHLSAGYLKEVCDERGKFNYYINLNPKVTLKPKYNMLRHAGSIYSLAMYEDVFPDKGTRAVIGRAVDFMNRRSIAALPESDDVLAVWSYPELSGSGGPVQAKLGGTGLGLVALMSVEKVMPGTTSLETLRKLANFILFMQKEDGSFYSKYYPQQGGRNDEWTSLYYPGEAALGLMMLYEKDRSQKWLDAAARAIAYLARLRHGRSSVEPDHWALLATSKLMPNYFMTNQPVHHRDVLNHAVQISSGMYSRSGGPPEGSVIFGSLTGDGRTTPTATRLEGLQAALEFIPEDMGTLRKDIMEKVSHSIRFLVNSQVKSGKYAGAIPRSVILLPEKHPAYSASDNMRATEVRIDYVQHALSAMIQYRDQIKER